jgi:hypothetical protein
MAGRRQGGTMAEAARYPAARLRQFTADVLARVGLPADAAASARRPAPR